MVLVELDVGNIMPYVTREAPYHTGDYHLSLCIHDYLPLIMNSVLIGSRSLPSFVVLEIGYRRDALY